MGEALRLHRVDEGQKVIDALELAVGDVQPPQPVADLGPRATPQHRVSLPDARDHALVAGHLQARVDGPAQLVTERGLDPLSRVAHGSWPTLAI